MVLSVDEKSQIQALDRTQPVLPLRPGSPATHTHDYRRNAVTSLFAALNTATGEILGKCFRKRHLNGGSIRNAAGVDAELNLGNHAIVNAAEHKVDGG